MEHAGTAATGSALRAADVLTNAKRDADCRRHAGPWNRIDDGDLQRRLRHPRPASSVRRAEPARRPAHDQRNGRPLRQRAVAAELHESEGNGEPGVREPRGCRRDGTHVDRRGRSPESRWRTSQRWILRSAGCPGVPRQNVSSGREPTGSGARGRAGPFVVAAAVRGRSKCPRPNRRSGFTGSPGRRRDATGVRVSGRTRLLAAAAVR